MFGVLHEMIDLFDSRVETFVRLVRYIVVYLVKMNMMTYLRGRF